MMPEDLRTQLSNPEKYFDIAIVEGPRIYVAHVLRTMLGNELVDVCVVGDYVCSTFIEYIGIPRICVVDGATLRELHRDVPWTCFASVRRCVNPRGCISTNCIEVLNALPRAVPTLLYVEGEEDLLALYATASKICRYVLFGIPGRGVAIVDTERNYVKAINVLSRFRLVELDVMNYRIAET